ncbi:uncharacterized protein ARMOST_05532 [Armillaria ostoyae]|uniref:F-box domain-containing protein n=1 Tax=Armillaria ostoyae TaxID=47428 RepID=A0A284R0F4_ARMOS|nr:uncharacterized protein ARMOST_05532 [Armillaria ostoyae]
MLPTYAFTVEEMLARHDWALTFVHPPDVDSLFRTNNMPSPAQAVQIKASLDSLEAPLAEVQSYLNLLRDAVTSLETQMSRLQSLRHDYTTAFSPIRRVPSEVLAKILCCSWENSRADKGSSKFNVFVMRDGPWRLGQVCGLWRSAVETFCPELWSTLSINDPLYPSLKNKHVEVLRCILERSCNHPLHFTFDRPSANSDTSLQVMEQCFNIMIAHSARWETAEIIVPPLFIPRLNLIRGKIDWLKKMNLEVCFNNSGLESKSIHAFEIAPSLQVLHLRGMHPEANILFPTVNLVSFSDHRPWSGDRLDPEYLGVVKSAPNLRSFSYIDFDVVRPISTSHTLERAINSSIEKLSTCSLDFMRGVILPSLKEVAPLSTVTWGYPVNALYGLNEMLIHSQCSLTRLALDDIALDENLPVILQLSPQLEEFSIDLRQEWMDEYDPVMRDLVIRMKETIIVEGSPQHCLVPSLQRFTIGLYHVCSVTLSFLDLNFVEMIASRVHGPHFVPQLTKLYLLVLGYMWTSCLDEDDVLALNGLKDKDLDVFVILRSADP